MAGKLFRDKTEEEHTTSLAAFLPGGKPFLASRLSGTSLRNLLAGLATELVRVDGLINDITYEHQIDQTTYLISEWEKALGIPDGCFTNTGTIAERRLGVLTKLGSMSVQTEQDFIDLAALLGYVVFIQSGAERGMFPLEFPAYFYDSPQTVRFLMITTVETLQIPIVFPLAFPIEFGSGINTILECVFRRIKPANVDILFEYKLPELGAVIKEDGFYYIGLEDGSILLME